MVATSGGSKKIRCRRDGQGGFGASQVREQEETVGNEAHQVGRVGVVEGDPLGRDFDDEGPRRRNFGSGCPRDRDFDDLGLGAGGGPMAAIRRGGSPVCGSTSSQTGEVPLVSGLCESVGHV